MEETRDRERQWRSSKEEEEEEEEEELFPQSKPCSSIPTPSMAMDETCIALEEGKVEIFRRFFADIGENKEEEIQRHVQRIRRERNRWLHSNAEKKFSYRRKFRVQALLAISVLGILLLCLMATAFYVLRRQHQHFSDRFAFDNHNLMERRVDADEAILNWELYMKSPPFKFMHFWQNKFMSPREELNGNILAVRDVYARRLLRPSSWSSSTTTT